MRVKIGDMHASPASTVIAELGHDDRSPNVAAASGRTCDAPSSSSRAGSRSATCSSASSRSSPPRAAISGQAGVWVLWGGICDALDGQVARATNAGTQFGEELDSLVDADLVRPRARR